MDPDELAQFVDRHTHQFSLRDGAQVSVRPIVPGDKQGIADGLSRLSSQSRYRRFMAPTDHLSDEHLRFFTEIDYHHHFAWAAFALDEPGQPGIGIARYVCDTDNPEIAEPAVAILDNYHNRGLGTLLLSLLANTALENGVKQFRASLLAENQPMQDLLKQFGAHFQQDGAGVLTAEFGLPIEDRVRFHLLSNLIRSVGSATVKRARGVFNLT